VRLVDESNNQVGVVPKYEALNRAREVGLDLVEVAPTSDPPVCRIMDYGKWQYEQKRKIREAHKKSQHHNVSLKEIRLRPETDTRDLEIKLKHGREFLEKGHRERGYAMLEKITELLQDLAKVERPARMAGRRMTLLLVPR